MINFLRTQPIYSFIFCLLLLLGMQAFAHLAHWETFNITHFENIWLNFFTTTALVCAEIILMYQITKTISVARKESMLPSFLFLLVMFILMKYTSVSMHTHLGFIAWLGVLRLAFHLKRAQHMLLLLTYTLALCGTAFVAESFWLYLFLLPIVFFSPFAEMRYFLLWVFALCLWALYDVYFHAFGFNHYAYATLKSTFKPFYHTHFLANTDFWQKAMLGLFFSSLSLAVFTHFAQQQKARKSIERSVRWQFFLLMLGSIVPVLFIQNTATFFWLMTSLAWSFWISYAFIALDKLWQEILLLLIALFIGVLLFVPL